MILNIYSLMYVADLESKKFSGRIYKGKEKIDCYVRGACILDRSLKLNGFSQGLTLLVNNETAVQESLTRIGYSDLKLKFIDFELDVPIGCRFYSAHYKIDVFKYFGTRPDDEYSVLLDSDVVSITPFRDDFYAVVEKGIPMVYTLPGYGGLKKYIDVNKIVDDVDWMLWAGGEFIGGDNQFYKLLYEDILKFKGRYWDNIHNNLFHVGDEMLTSIALRHLHGKFSLVDIGSLGIIHRYWSRFDNAKYTSYNTTLVHFPGDKAFFDKVNPNQDSIKGLMRGYPAYRIWCLCKGFVNKLLDKGWRSKL